MGSAADPACISPSAIDCSSHFRGNWSTCYLDTGRLEIEIRFSIKLSYALSFVLECLCVWPGLCYIQPGALSEPQQLVWGFHPLNRCCTCQLWMCLHSSCMLFLGSSFKGNLSIHVQSVWNDSIAGLTFNLNIKPHVSLTACWKEYSGCGKQCFFSYILLKYFRQLYCFSGLFDFGYWSMNVYMVRIASCV